MNIKQYFSGSVFLCMLLSLCCCKEKPRSIETRFTKEDSITDTFLALQDSMLQTWNMMINDDNLKLKAMRNLLHELIVSNADDPQLLKSLEERLKQLKNIRYTQKSMANSDVIEEYDFASTSLINELISLAESKPQFAYNTTLQKLVDEIRLADQRVNTYRAEYDLIAEEYNRFIEKNKTFLKEVQQDSFLEKKPLFQMVADEE